MSSYSVENIHIRLRDELERLGLSMADAARNMGEENSQGLRDVCAGRKRASAELIAKLILLDADILYILTGQNNATPRIGDIAKQFRIGGLVESVAQNKQPLSVRELAMLDGFRLASEQDKKAIERMVDLAAHAVTAPAANSD